jgi:hypothetical protein
MSSASARAGGGWPLGKLRRNIGDCLLQCAGLHARGARRENAEDSDRVRCTSKVIAEISRKNVSVGGQHRFSD